MIPSSRVVVARGAWAAEAAVVAEIEARLPRGELSAAPVVVLVPSHRLREHLLGRLAERRPAWLGLRIATLAGLADEILDRTGAAAPPGDALVALLVRRLAAQQRALAAPLATLVDGYAAVVGAVRDLLDAGFDEAHLDAVDERLALERAVVGASAVERALAIARVAAGVRRELATHGLHTSADRLFAAAQQLSVDPDRALPAHAVVVHGFADLTGAGTDLVEALVRHRPTTVVLDSPPELDGSEADWRFGRRLRQRLEGLADVTVADESPADAEIRAFRATDSTREARGAVGWLAADPPPARWEACAIVARDLESDLPAWSRELDRQAVPFSVEATPDTALARRATGLVEILAHGAETPLGVALAVATERLETVSGVPVADLRLAFALAGARTLGAAAGVSVSAESVALPVRDHFEDDSDGVRLRSRELSGAALSAAVARLAALLRGVEAIAAWQPIGARVATTVAWLENALPSETATTLSGPLETLGSAELTSFEVDADEWRRLVEHAWSAELAEPRGSGSGVALLSVTGARGRTFERLALVGLSRDRFPRSVRNDALLPDALRLRLRELLPDLPVKAEGHDEERYLFAQLVASARELALFRPLADSQGRSLAPSPLLDEARRGRGVPEAPAPLPERLGALDAAIATALAGEPAALARDLAAALDDARHRFGGRPTVEAHTIATTRTALLARRSADPADPSTGRLGPYLGGVGAVAHADPRRRVPYVTALEHLAGCGWRLFLERILRLAPLPELVETLPSLPSRLVGNVVHEVLERLFPGAREIPLATAMAGEPRAAVWPEPAELARRVRAVSRRQLADEGLDPLLFEATLAREAEAVLELVRALEWPRGVRELLAVEVQGEARFELAEGARSIRFKADRLERVDGEFWLTDYKTGRPLSTAVRPETQARHLAAKIASGEALQLAVYLRGVAGAAARARYLNLQVDLDDRARELAIAPAELAALPLAPVIEALFAAWDQGAFVPRLLEPDRRTTYAGCAWCDVREACVQGDSAARQCLARWVESSPHEGRWEQAARAWWALRPSKGRDAAAEDDA